MIMDAMYLPFTEKQLLAHFVKNERHLDYYKDSVKRYHEYIMKNPQSRGRSLLDMKKPRQIEKDERFWTASCMMTVFHSVHRQQHLAELFTMAYGTTPPLSGLDSWKECFRDELNLFFEVDLPSPAAYKEWLFQNLRQQQLIPHVLDSAKGKGNLEGPTQVDAVLINHSNGFATIIEAKVLSDIGCQITYDVARNQIARNIDVMLEENRHLCEPLKSREPERTLFLLLTPELFKTNYSSRFYGYKFNDYKKNPESIEADLPHRKNQDWREVSSRLGWLTWEDFNRVDEACCPWLAQ